LVLLAVLAGLMTLAPAASAQEPPATIGQTVMTTASTANGECGSPANLQAQEPDPGNTNAERLSYLPLNRWMGSTSDLHSRLGAGVTDDIPQKLSRNLVQSFALSIGDSFWSMTGGLVTFATEYSVLDKAGCAADRSAASLGNGLMSGIVPVLLAGGILLLLWRAKQGAEKPGKKIVQMVGTLGLFAVLLNGANATAKTHRISPGSPAYFAIQLDSVVTNMASIPTAALSENMPQAQAYGTSGTTLPGDPMSCRNYVANLRDMYLHTGSRGVNAAKIPVAISAMWEQSGLTSYMRIQYGTKNPYGDRMYCRMLERSAGKSQAEQFEVMAHEPAGDSQIAKEARAAAKTNGAKFNDGPRSELFEGGNNKTEDQAGIWWAVCALKNDGTFTTPKLNGGYAGSWADVNERSASPEDVKGISEECDDTFKNWGADSGLFSWEDSASDIERMTDDTPGPRDFLLSWHGDAISSGLAVAIVYVVASLVVLIVFGLIAVGVIIAKTVGVVMIVMIFLLLTMALVPSQGDQSKLGKFIKFWAGMTLYSAGLMFILALVALVTGFINQVGIASFGGGSLMGILWMGFAPVTAIVLLHVVFKHAGGMPSPFKPGSAMAYGAAVGGAGAALGVGIDRMARRGRGTASSFAGQAGANKLNRKGQSGKGKGTDQKRKVKPEGGDKTSTKQELPGARERIKGAVGREVDSETGEKTGKLRGAPLRVGAAMERAGGAAGAQRKANRKAAYQDWREKGGYKRMAKRGAVGAGVVAMTGLGGAGAILTSPVAIPVGAAVAARTLHRSRKAAQERRANGVTQSMGSAVLRSNNQDVARLRDSTKRRRDAVREAEEERVRLIRENAGKGGPADG
jgi:hypothetical protein